MSTPARPRPKVTVLGECMLSSDNSVGLLAAVGANRETSAHVACKVRRGTLVPLWLREVPSNSQSARSACRVLCGQVGREGRSFVGIVETPNEFDVSPRRCPSGTQALTQCNMCVLACCLGPHRRWQQAAKMRRRVVAVAVLVGLAAAARQVTAAACMQPRAVMYNGER
jgi:hypothetical protein